MRSAESVRKPRGALHRVSRNPRTKTNTQVLAVIRHSADVGKSCPPPGRSDPIKLFVSATGPIARPLIAGLLRQDHVGTGLTRSEAGARHLAEPGEEIARVSAFVGDAVDHALRQPRAEIIIDQLTPCPRTLPRWPRPPQAIGSCGSRAATSIVSQGLALSNM
jgi:hypothetical protein